MPVAVEWKVEPVQGSDVVKRSLMPPEPAQPLPWEAAVAGQVVVSCATEGETTPPAVPNEPPATRLPFGSVVKLLTQWFIPWPIADQLVPFQRAMQEALTPPAAVNVPPATRSPFGSVVRASTSSFVPEPSADQLVPFQRAMWFALTPPAVVK